MPTTGRSNQIHEPPRFLTGELSQGPSCSQVRLLVRAIATEVQHSDHHEVGGYRRAIRCQNQLTRSRGQWAKSRNPTRQAALPLQASLGLHRQSAVVNTTKSGVLTPPVQVLAPESTDRPASQLARLGVAQGFSLTL
jgi:hypothetical protein